MCSLQIDMVVNERCRKRFSARLAYARKVHRAWAFARELFVCRISYKIFVSESPDSNLS
jgi:hypothetical protein